jgi:Kef-type K+ transport system membrane component KefB
VVWRSGPLAKTDVVTMVKEAGEVGFLLILYEDGLEIDLPKLRELVPSLRFAAILGGVEFMSSISLLLLPRARSIEIAQES